MTYNKLYNFLSKSIFLMFLLLGAKAFGFVDQGAVNNYEEVITPFSADGGSSFATCGSTIPEVKTRIKGLINASGDSCTQYRQSEYREQGSCTSTTNQQFQKYTRVYNECTNTCLKTIPDEFTENLPIDGLCGADTITSFGLDVTHAECSCPKTIDPPKYLLYYDPLFGTPSEDNSTCPEIDQGYIVWSTAIVPSVAQCSSTTLNAPYSPPGATTIYTDIHWSDCLNSCVSFSSSCPRGTTADSGVCNSMSPETNGTCSAWTSTGITEYTSGCQEGFVCDTDDTQLVYYNVSCVGDSDDNSSNTDATLPSDVNSSENLDANSSLGLTKQDVIDAINESDVAKDETLQKVVDESILTNEKLDATNVKLDDLNSKIDTSNTSLEAIDQSIKDGLSSLESSTGETNNKLDLIHNSSLRNIDAINNMKSGLENAIGVASANNSNGLRALADKLDGNGSGLKIDLDKYFTGEDPFDGNYTDGSEKFGTLTQELNNSIGRWYILDPMGISRMNSSYSIPTIGFDIGYGQMNFISAESFNDVPIDFIRQVFLFIATMGGLIIFFRTV